MTKEELLEKLKDVPGDARVYFPIIWKDLDDDPGGEVLLVTDVECFVSGTSEYPWPMLCSGSGAEYVILDGEIEE